MSNAKIVFEFTNQLSELLFSGVPMRQAVQQMGDMRSNAVRLRQTCAEVGAGLEDGRTLSSVLAGCASARFPLWYTAFVSAAEESGCMGETLLFLAKTLGAKQKAFSEFMSALVYPLVVVALCAACSVWAALSFPQFFASESFSNDASFAGGVVSSFALSSLFMLAVTFFVALVLKAVLAINPCLSLMHALAFLTNRGTSLSESLECAVPVVEKNERLCTAVLSIREQLLQGERIDTAFCEQLETAGFGAAAKIVSAQLALAQSGAKRNVFEKTAEVLSQKTEKLRSSVLSCEQPVLLCCAAIYMLILLKNTLMPYITNFGG